MKKHKPIRLFVPYSIWQVIDSTVKTNKEIYVYLIHYILYKPVTDRRLDNYVPLNKEKLALLIGCNVTPYIKNLLIYDLIQSDNKFIPNQKACYYRIHEKHKIDCNYYDLQPTTTLFKNLIHDIKIQKSNYSKLEPFLNEMRVKFMDIQFDYQGALKWLETVTDEQKKVSYAIAINQLHDKRFRYFKRNKTNNRLDSNLTNLKKDLRQFIVGDYVQIDLKNSQLFFFSFFLGKITEILKYFNLKRMEINETNINNTLGSVHTSLKLRNDMKILVFIFGIQTVKSLLLSRNTSEVAYYTNLSMFKKWATDGILYDEFVKKFNNKFTRDEVKKMILEVLYSSNSFTKNFRTFIPYEKEKQVFSSVFPVIYEMIVALKQKDNKRLAMCLQKMESEIFIDKVAKDLVEAGIVPFTIHDSIIVPSPQQEKAFTIIEAVFKREIGIVPKFHIDKLNTN